MTDKGGLAPVQDLIDAPVTELNEEQPTWIFIPDKKYFILLSLNLKVIMGFLNQVRWEKTTQVTLKYIWKV